MARSVRLSTASDIVDLVDFIQLLGMNARTGRLRIRQGTEERELVLENGAIVELTGGPEPVAAEGVDAETLRRHEVVESLIDVVGWTDPDLEFTELEEGELASLRDAARGPPLSVQGTLLEVLQTRDLLARVAETIPDLDSILIADANRRGDYVGSPYGSVLEALDGRRTVREAISSFGLEKFDALERLATLRKQKVAVPVDVLQLEMLAWDHESNGDSERALLVYRLLRREDAANIRIIKNIAGVLAHLERTAEAAEALAEYADACIRDEVTAEALSSYVLAVRFDPANVSIRERYVDALAREGPSPKLVDAYVELADRYLAIEDHEMAKNALRRILRLAPDHVGARRRLATLCQRVGEEGAAVSELSQLAAGLRAAGKIDEARAACREALELDAGCIEARMTLAELLLDRGETALALAEVRALEVNLRSVGAMAEDEVPAEVARLLERLLELDSRNAGALETLALAAANGGDESRAVELEKRLVAVLASRGDLRGAIGVVERMIHRLPEAFELHAQLAGLYEQIDEGMRASAIYEFAGQGLLAAGRHAEAARVFGRLLELDPESADASLGFARSLRGRGELHRAMMRYREAARILEDGDQEGEAVSVLEEALECDPVDPDCTIRAAAIHARRGHRRRAIHLYLAALKACRERGDDAQASMFRGRVLELEPDNVIALAHD